VGIAALMLMIGILGLAGLMLVIGFALVGLAAAGVLVVGATFSSLLRSLSQRYRAEPRAGSGDIGLGQQAVGHCRLLYRLG
jgi:hypothetical protein